MECIEKLVDNIYNSCKIPFQLEIEDLGVYETDDYKKEDSLCKTLKFNDAKCCINVNAAFGNTINLLSYCIKNGLQDVFINKENIIQLLLQEKDIEKDMISTVWPTLMGKFYLIDIFIDKNINESFAYLKEVYAGSNIEIMLKGNNILIVGNFEDIGEHIISIRDTLMNNVKCRYYICYSLVDNYMELKKTYEECSYKLELANKYKLTETIIDERKLILEGIIDSVSDSMKEKIYNSFNEGFSLLDNEMIKTIEVFFRCGLNLSDAAKELYIHRNTLIYRLDKIEKYTSYDIREFNNAVLFKIVFFVWKEKKQKNF